MKIFFLIIILSIAGAGGFVYWQIPSEETIKGCFKTSMYGLDLCPTEKTYVKIKNISPKLQRAILHTEDSGFYAHKGFDEEGLTRCYEKLKETHKITCGGSTITQQLAKNLFLYKDKTFVRKGLEALITIKLEKTLTKKEILERYLNVVQFGKNIYGVKQAAQFYFKKQPSELDVVESAFLAMVLPNPEKYSQSYYRKDLTRFARKRLSGIITDMHRYKSLTDEDYFAAMGKLEYFLTAGQAQMNADPQQLSSDDMSEMLDDAGVEPPAAAQAPTTESTEPANN
ncbi:monofunctional biosynthetic peptidoglycan transglycosylase [Bdellovibrio sp. qaytius]|nr:monofunctional biosynthetic peptidoglycan transglycosylase [Bdellovibrio sp. qaytius]